MYQDIKLCICPECKQLKENVDSRRQNTRYVDDRCCSNTHFMSCPECFEDREAYWADMWEMVW